MPSSVRVAALVGHGMSAALAGRLLSSPRFAARMEKAVEARLAPLPALNQEQHLVLAMDEADLALLVRQAGAIHHAHSITAIVGGPALRMLVDLVGDGLRTLAIKGRALARPHAALAPEAIAAAIPAAGVGCLAAWCAAQPAPVAARVELQMAENAEPVEGGAAIISFLLGKST